MSSESGSVHGPCCRGSFVILDRPIKKYPADVRWWHWQLRHLCALAKPGLLYYAEGKRDVYRLDLVSNTRRHIYRIPLRGHAERAREDWISCVAARDDWVCVGISEGNKTSEGKFVVIRIEDDGDASDEPSLTASSFKAEVRTHNEGEDVINSISIWKPEDAVGDEETVAILTNNDKTIRFFHLSTYRFLSTIDVGIQTNHASISPDGKRMVAVTDVDEDPDARPKKPTLYFYRAQDDAEGSASLLSYANRHITSTGKRGHPHIWKPDCPPIHASGESLFSSGFSSSGEYCAIANQGGSIMVYRLAEFSQEPEELVTIQTSQPVAKDRGASKDQPGMIRTLLFSPAPWNLLIWAEADGRIGVADQKSGFRNHQIIDLRDLKTEDVRVKSESDEPDLQHIRDEMNSAVQNYDSRPLRLRRYDTPPAWETREEWRRAREQRLQMGEYAEPGPDHPFRRRVNLAHSQPSSRLSTELMRNRNLPSPLNPATRSSHSPTSSNLSINHLPSLRQRASDNFRSQLFAPTRSGEPPSPEETTASIYRAAEAAAHRVTQSENAARRRDRTASVDDRSAQLSQLEYADALRQGRARYEQERANAIRRRAAAGLVAAAHPDSPPPRSIPQVGSFEPPVIMNQTDSEETDSDVEEEPPTTIDFRRSPRFGLGDGVDEDMPRTAIETPVFNTREDTSPTSPRSRPTSQQRSNAPQPVLPNLNDPADIQAYLRLREMDDLARLQSNSSNALSSPISRSTGAPGWTSTGTLSTIPNTSVTDNSRRSSTGLPPATFNADILRQANAEAGRTIRQARRRGGVIANTARRAAAAAMGNPNLDNLLPSGRTLSSFYEVERLGYLDDRHSGQDWSISGLAMEPDGQYLYVAMQCGIMRLEMDLVRQSFFPAPVSRRSDWE